MFVQESFQPRVVWRGSLAHSPGRKLELSPVRTGSGRYPALHSWCMAHPFYPHRPDTMSTLQKVTAILRDALSLGSRADSLTLDTPLLGGIPEFDSMAVVTVVTMIEDVFGMTVDDDDLSADVFATVGSLVRFVDQQAPA